MIRDLCRQRRKRAGLDKRPAERPECEPRHNRDARPLAPVNRFVAHDLKNRLMARTVQRGKISSSNLQLPVSTSPLSQTLRHVRQRARDCSEIRGVCDLRPMRFRGQFDLVSWLLERGNVARYSPNKIASYFDVIRVYPIKGGLVGSQRRPNPGYSRAFAK